MCSTELTHTRPSILSSPFLFPSPLLSPIPCPPPRPSFFVPVLYVRRCPIDLDHVHGSMRGGMDGDSSLHFSGGKALDSTAARCVLRVLQQLGLFHFHFPWFDRTNHIIIVISDIESLIVPLDSRCLLCSEPCKRARKENAIFGNQFFVIISNVFLKLSVYHFVSFKVYIAARQRYMLSLMTSLLQRSHNNNNNPFACP
ncbi:hypothetical protein BC939DRAFT_98206 [Gamsiella multidivaricata]|uniref:uncharacterized protein n=1 Tax=Gamsiella multidivaricata TaxID=101098 RepID=UPI0022202F64|nr:uncharacterized protein BC939DRAFT_98206 [Gamsiella multidivaricata]KAI7832217.1 hypothetical protein BC939DRAFT_98206 [Gamsiella multidivaricata]